MAIMATLAISGPATASEGTHHLVLTHIAPGPDDAGIEVSGTVSEGGRFGTITVTGWRGTLSSSDGCSGWFNTHCALPLSEAVWKAYPELDPPIPESLTFETDDGAIRMICTISTIDEVEGLVNNCFVAWQMQAVEPSIPGECEGYFGADLGYCVGLAAREVYGLRSVEIGPAVQPAGEDFPEI